MGVIQLISVISEMKGSGISVMTYVLRNQKKKLFKENFAKNRTKYFYTGGW